MIRVDGHRAAIGDGGPASLWVMPVEHLGTP
jgi:hypothetical protein